MLHRFSRVWLCATLWTAALQAPLFTGFSRQERWRGLPHPPHKQSQCRRVSRGTACAEELAEGSQDSFQTPHPAPLRRLPGAGGQGLEWGCRPSLFVRFPSGACARLPCAPHSRPARAPEPKAGRGLRSGLRTGLTRAARAAEPGEPSQRPFSGGYEQAAERGVFATNTQRTAGWRDTAWWSSPTRPGVPARSLGRGWGVT